MELAESTREKFSGAILGCAVGDAVGLCFQFASPPLGPAQSLDDFRYSPFGEYPAGMYSDDTDMTLAVMRAILEAGGVDGETIAREFVRTWDTYPMVDPGISCSDAISALKHGMPWDRSGTAEGRAGNGTAMRAAPVGLWDFDDIDALRRDSETQSIITHKDRRAIAGATAVAAAVAYNINNNELDREEFLAFIKTGLRIDGGTPFIRYLDAMPKLLNMPERDAISGIARAGQEETFTADYITPFVVPTVLVSLYAFLKRPDSFLDALALVYRAGGDIDTTGAITGAIAGSHLGDKAIPRHLLDGLYRREEIAALVNDFWLARRKRRQSPSSEK